MSSSRNIPRCLLIWVTTCLVLISIACQVSSLLPTATPTATLPPAVASPLQARLLGQWKVINGGPWGDAILTFEADGGFTIVDSLQQKDGEGSYFFTSENTIAFSFPNYQGSAEIEFQSDDEMDLSVTTSDQVFGILYSAERVK